jgi:hypothetical protein
MIFGCWILQGKIFAASGGDYVPSMRSFCSLAKNVSAAELRGQSRTPLMIRCNFVDGLIKIMLNRRQFCRRLGNLTDTIMQEIWSSARRDSQQSIPHSNNIHQSAPPCLETTVDSQ